jgi:hypothetical protein
MDHRVGLGSLERRKFLFSARNRIDIDSYESLSREFKCSLNRAKHVALYRNTQVRFTEADDVKSPCRSLCYCNSKRLRITEEV